MGKQRLATWASPPKQRPRDVSPPRGARVMPSAGEFMGNGFGAHTVPMPEFEEESRSLNNSKKTVRQILPAYLRSGTVPNGPKRPGSAGRSSEHVSFNLSESMDVSASADGIRD